MARRILNRKELRADHDAAEQRQGEEEEHDDAEEDDEGEDEVEAEAGEEPPEAAEQEPVKKRKPAAKVAKPRSRVRAPKVTRMKVVWGVFSNANQRVAVFDYPKRQDAHELAAKLSADKKTTFYVQPVKEPMEEKKAE
jgi:hypothetical protein